MKRDDLLQRLRERVEPWDLLVIGGGATGAGIAVDAAARGYAVALLEQHDFGKGTSSRSTKLIHGGVRYLQQGNLSLVMEALKERGILRENAPHLVRDLRFIVPNYAWWEAPFYGIGMKVYDLLGGRYGFGPSRHLSRDEVLAAIPTLATDGLRGGVQYYDGQFDDARLLINLVQTAVEQGAVPINYVRVDGLVKDGEGLVAGVTATDVETGSKFSIAARCVINATGPFADGVLRMDDPQAERLIDPSQGVHLVLGREFLPGDSAIMVPRTSDGRVLFAIPWLGVTLIGTTDTPIDEPSLEPKPLAEEIEFILSTAAQYLEHDPSRADVRSVFVGIRPLAKAGAGADTAALSREHSIHIARSGLLTIIGGKWTTYRRMAADVVDHAATLARLDERDCPTRELRIHGHDSAVRGEFAAYGADAGDLQTLLGTDPAWAELVHPALSIRRGQTIWSARHEMARTVEDVLARRTRALLLDARAARAAAPVVAADLAAELHRDRAWVDRQIREFQALADSYTIR